MCWYFKRLYHFYCYLLSIFLKYLQYTREHTVSGEDAVPVLPEGFSSSSVSVIGGTIKGLLWCIVAANR